MATQNLLNPKHVAPVNEALAQKVLQKAIDIGVRVFCVCGGNRNALLAWVLKDNPFLTVYDWYEERSAAFFALGRARALGQPVAVVTTSGTAVGELLAAAMEAHYTSSPLLLLTADRPRRFRGTGAPQAAEQNGIFGCYCRFAEDVEGEEETFLETWDQRGPAHLNICFEEPETPLYPIPLYPSRQQWNIPCEQKGDPRSFSAWLGSVKAPLVIVNALPEKAQEPVRQMLLRLQAPVYLEGLSGLREEASLQPLRIEQLDGILNKLQEIDYPLDSILRIGGVPTHRIWRDLEERTQELSIFSMSPYPFSGLSGEGVLHLSTAAQWQEVMQLARPFATDFSFWKKRDIRETEIFSQMLKENSKKELSWVRWISEQIPGNSLVYLGNSLPIRHWDRAATSFPKQLQVFGNRGLNGIDGQLSTFFGLCRADRENWGIFGDLTALYDFPAFWVLPKLASCQIRIVILNNGGGQIFQMKRRGEELANLHSLSFSHLAGFWNLPYLRFDERPVSFSLHPHQLIEITLV